MVSVVVSRTERSLTRRHCRRGVARLCQVWHGKIWDGSPPYCSCYLSSLFGRDRRGHHLHDCL